MTSVQLKDNIPDTTSVNVYIAMQHPMSDVMYTWDSTKTKLEKYNRKKIVEKVQAKFGNTAAIHDTYGAWTNVIILPDDWTSSLPASVQYYLNTFIVDIVTRRGFESCAVITLTELVHGGYDNANASKWEEFVPPIDADYMYRAQDMDVHTLESARFASMQSRQGNVFSYHNQHLPKYGTITMDVHATKKHSRKKKSSKKHSRQRN
jgi:hypothetical protein